MTTQTLEERAFGRCTGRNGGGCESACANYAGHEPVCACGHLTDVHAIKDARIVDGWFADEDA